MIVTSGSAAMTLINAEIEYARTVYSERQADFELNFKLDPAHALTWKSVGVIHAQERLEFVSGIVQGITWHINNESATVASIVGRLEKFQKHETDRYLEGAFNETSSSSMASNLVGIERSKARGEYLKRDLQELIAAVKRASSVQ